MTLQPFSTQKRLDRRGGATLQPFSKRARRSNLLATLQPFSQTVTTHQPFRHVLAALQPFRRAGATLQPFPLHKLDAPTFFRKRPTLQPFGVGEKVGASLPSGKTKNMSSKRLERRACASRRSDLFPARHRRSNLFCASRPIRMTPQPFFVQKRLDRRSWRVGNEGTVQPFRGSF